MGILPILLFPLSRVAQTSLLLLVTNRMSVRCSISALLVFSLLVPAFGQSTKKKSGSSSAALTSYKPQVTANGVPIVHAASVIVVDAITGEVLHAKNADERRPPASTQKLLTALIIAESGGLDQKVRVAPSDTWAEPTKLYLKPGDLYTRRQLLEILLVRSMNDVARCLARDNASSVELFCLKMNRRAAELGAWNSRFANPNGLPAPGQYSTARDLARIAQAAYRNPVIRSMVSKKNIVFQYADGRTREFTNTNRVLRNYSLCNGMKTGYTDAAGFCLVASGSSDTRDAIVVVLGDKKQWVWKDAYSLLSWALTNGTFSSAGI
jgi:serine-type D-Ala-D-Ala carboxypeptidase (penicillin-binding protein 5/6)